MYTIFNLPIGKTNDQMKEHLKETVIPFLRKQGFNGSFPNFRRIHDDNYQVLNFQFSKHGGSFCINMTVVEKVDNFFKVKKSDLKSIGGRRLGTRKKFLENKQNQDHWFKFMRGIIFYRKAYIKAAEEVINKFEQEGDLIYEDAVAGINKPFGDEIILQAN